jgi:hypothetical protein
LGIGGIFLGGIIGKIISKSLIRIIIEDRYLRSKNYEAPQACINNIKVEIQNIFFICVFFATGYLINSR